MLCGGFDKLNHRGINVVVEPVETTLETIS